MSDTEHTTSGSNEKEVEEQRRTWTIFVKPIYFCRYSYSSRGSRSGTVGCLKLSAK